MFVSNTIKLLGVEHEELTRRANSRSGQADNARHAQLNLLWMRVRPGPRSARSWTAPIAHRSMGQTVAAERLAGLFSRHAGQLPTTLTPALEARILEWSVNPQSSRWIDTLEHAQTCRPGGRQSHHGGTGIAQAWVATASAEGLLGLDDPGFESKAAEITRLICIHRSTQRWSASMKRLRSGRWIARTRYCHSLREGPNGMALSLPATGRSLSRGIQCKTGEVLGKTAAHHTSAEFIALLTTSWLISEQPRST